MIKPIILSRNFALALTLAMAVFLVNSTARADIPRPPKPAPTEDTAKPNPGEPQLQITLEKDGKVAHLRLPRSVVQGLSAHTPRADAGISPARTVVAGLALASALAVGGLFLARGFGRGRNLIVIAILGGGGLFTTFTLADVPPFNPNATHWHRLPPPVAENTAMSVVIETIDDGPIQLTIPADQVAKIAQLPTTRPADSTGR